MNEPGAVVIIPAAGRGQRMGRDIPKQYLPVDGQPLLAHTLRAIHACERVSGLLVAIHPDDRQRFDAIASSVGPKLRPAVIGGTQRVDSVQQALNALEVADDIVLVHDAVRPWVSTDLVTNIVEAALRHGAAIAAVPATDTVKQVEDGIVIGTPDRRQLWNAQTPQGFRRSLLEEAFARRDPSQPATDESSLVEACGHRVHIVHGDPTNVKVTTPQDLPTVGDSSRAMRVGQGYDVHAFTDDRPLILGGIQIEAQRGLAGHSDADVLTHAIIDALLGAMSMGDVGQIFPDTDQAYAGISSLVLLADVSSRLQAIGAQIVNVDSVVMAQAPRLSPYADQISARLAATLGIEASAVSVKATTTERLGFIGREEGIAAQAIALVSVTSTFRA